MKWSSSYQRRWIRAFDYHRQRVCTQLTNVHWRKVQIAGSIDPRHQKNNSSLFSNKTLRLITIQILHRLTAITRMLAVTLNTAVAELLSALCIVVTRVYQHHIARIHGFLAIWYGLGPLAGQIENKPTSLLSSDFTFPIDWATFLLPYQC